MLPTRPKGFTLIELLVVIAIIGILSAVVIASLANARAKAKEAALKTHAQEFQKLLQLEYSDNGSYANLAKGWIGGSTTNGETTCENRGYAGTYGPQALAICQGIVSILGTSYSQAFLVSGSQTYTIEVRYPSGLMYCVGSSGRNSDQVPYTGPGISSPGCSSNP